MPKIDSSDELKRKCAERKAQRKAGLVGTGSNPKSKKNLTGSRPKGGNALVAKVKDMIDAGHIDEAFETVLQVAADPSHKNWGHATKLIMERAAHLSHFEKDRVNQGHNAININISTVGEKPVEGVVVENGES